MFSTDTSFSMAICRRVPLTELQPRADSKKKQSQQLGRFFQSQSSQQCQ